MKIKSIKLTSRYEIEKTKGYTLKSNDAHIPLYQIEYEETTPTGLVATGTKLLSLGAEEKAHGLFKNLESSLAKQYEDAGVSAKLFKNEKNDNKEETMKAWTSSNTNKECETKYADELRKIKEGMKRQDEKKAEDKKADSSVWESLFDGNKDILDVTIQIGEMLNGSDVKEMIGKISKEIKKGV